MASSFLSNTSTRTSTNINPTNNNIILTPPPNISRPFLHTASTIIPTVPTAPTTTTTTDYHTRKRATTDINRPVTTSFTDRRFGSASHHRAAPPYISVVPRVEKSDQNSNQDPFSRLDFDLPPSAPIPIPNRRNPPSCPTTPLTAREEKGNYFHSIYQATPQKPQISSSLRPGYQHQSRTSLANLDTSSSASPSHFVASPKSSTMRRDQGTPLYTPTSPLSPTMSTRPVPSSRSNARRTAENLHLPSLPRFHPANFPSHDSTSHLPPRASRATTSHFQQRPVSEAQHKLHQYQRDLVANATRVSRSVLSPQVAVKPSPPRLQPLGSPGSPGPVTPMMLEGQGDYLIAGAIGGPTQMSPAREGRDIVERMIQKENEQRNYPGRHERVSPAVSPAGGRG